MERADLLNLALEQLGIDTEYYDALGHLHTLNTENKESFLSIFGIKDIEKDLKAREDKKWTTPLEPVYIERENRSEFRIYFYEHVDFDYNNAKLYIDKTQYPIDWPGKSEEYRIVNETIYHRHYFNVPKLNIGYHNLELVINSKTHKSRLIISPETCYFPDFLKDGKTTGVACHLYSIYSDFSQGVGDFTDLNMICQKTKEANGDIVLVQPWHYTSIVQGSDHSPYSPLSRLFLSPLYIDTVSLGYKVQNHPNLGQFVDYDSVIRYKIPLLKKHFNKNKNDKEFQQYIKNNKLLDSFATFCALYEKFDRESWKTWDKKYQKPNSKYVKEFAKQNADKILFNKYLQYISEKQLNATLDITKDLGMQIGLCNDLAVGAGHHSFEAWYYRDIFVQEASIGAPPDEMNEQGQSWGFPPYHPDNLRNSGYEIYIETLRRNMKTAGALRLDHAMHIMRLFWNISKDYKNMVGSYVAMPIDELLAILAVESHINKCVIIAEDLGTVAEGFREKIRDYDILSTKELYFELDELGHYKKPEDYDKISLSTVHTHDTATIKGYLHYHDLNLELDTGIIDNKTHRELKDKRKGNFDDLMARYGLKYKHELQDIFHKMILESSSCISLIYLDDLTMEKEQLNLPGTTFEHRNWCRKLSASLEEFDIKL